MEKSVIEYVIRKGFGRWIRRQREERIGGKLTQADVGRGIDRDRTVIGELEAGKTSLTEENLVGLIHLFDLTPTQAFGELLDLVEKAERESYELPDHGRRPGEELRSRDGARTAADRSDDWWQQSRRDVELAELAMQTRFYEWAAFAAHQAAEKAVRALLPVFAPSVVATHSIAGLLHELPPRIEVPAGVSTAAVELDRHREASRYPDALPVGHPGRLYDEGAASAALMQARRVVEFCELGGHG